MQNLRHPLISAALLLMSGAINGCANNHDGIINNDLKNNINNDQTALPSVSRNSWWRGFEDQQLDMIVQQALGQNLGIMQARELLLSVNSVDNAEEIKFLPVLISGIRPVQDAPARTNYLHATTDMSWELSLFGQSESARKMDKANVLSAETQLQGAKISVEVACVFNYLQYIYTIEGLKILDEQYQLQKDNVQLEEIRNRAHIASNLDVMKTELAEDNFTRSRYELLEIKSHSLRSLRLLTNNENLDINHSGEKILFSDFRIKSIPSDLLRTRPDIRQQEANVLKAGAELGFARAALYPRFSLLGSITYSYNVNDSSENTANRPLGIAPAIDIPIWDWHKRESLKSAKEHQLHAALIAYRESIMNGLSEVESAITALSYQEQRMNLVTSRFNRETHALDITEQADKLGFSSRYDINKIKESLLNDKQLQLYTALQRGVKIIDLYKSLGGALLENARDD